MHKLAQSIGNEHTTFFSILRSYLKGNVEHITVDTLYFNLSFTNLKEKKIQSLSFEAFLPITFKDQHKALGYW